MPTCCLPDTHLLFTWSFSQIIVLLLFLHNIFFYSLLLSFLSLLLLALDSLLSFLNFLLVSTTYYCFLIVFYNVKHTPAVIIKTSLVLKGAGMWIVVIRVAKLDSEVHLKQCEWRLYCDQHKSNGSKLIVKLQKVISKVWVQLSGVRWGVGCRYAVCRWGSIQFRW